jgi:HNH endonuclease
MIDLIANFSYKSQTKSYCLTKKMRTNTREKFWSRVCQGAHDDCWEWQGTLNSNGYGVFVIDRKYWGAHRFSFMLSNGRLKRGLCVGHLCHNRKCVNPAHLVQITAAENSQQMVMANRTRPARGIANSHAKLSDAAVREIRRIAVDLEGECKMMLKYRVGQLAIKEVFQRKRWKHVSDF